jgi:polyprenyl-phospho-N-acetylgalactosaminyl synthase
MISRSEQSGDSVAFIIPAYNEGSAIRSTIDAIPKEFSNLIIINDGSSDDTLMQIEKTRAQVISHSLNLGQGAALQTGIEYALMDENIKYFVTYDADGQHRIEDVRKMISYIKKHEVDIVLGSRFLGRTENMPKLKWLILKLAIWFTNVSSGIKLTDTHNGLRVFNRNAAQQMKLEMSDFSHASEIIERIAEKKLRYAEVPVTIIYTDYSRSKGQSLINAINISFDVLLNRLIKR